MFYMIEEPVESSTMELDYENDYSENVAVLKSLMDRFYEWWEILSTIKNTVHVSGFLEFIEYMKLLNKDCETANMEDYQLLVHLDELYVWLRDGTMPFSSDYGAFWKWCYHNNPSCTVNLLRHITFTLEDGRKNSKISSVNNSKKRKID